jgi:hypothetical protein
MILFSERFWPYRVNGAMRTSRPTRADQAGRAVPSPPLAASEHR